MDAGRELDALVAEKVMGWQRRTDIGYPAWQVPGTDRTGWGYGLPDASEFELPYFSTEIAAAWEVVERAVHFKIRRGDDGWIAEWGRNGARACRAGANTAPLAICLAALGAVRHSPV